MYQLKLTGRAKKELKNIKKIYEATISSALEEIKEDPFIGKALTRELTDRFSFKVGVYRIIYRVNRKDKIVNILTADHRATIYE